MKVEFPLTSDQLNALHLLLQAKREGTHCIVASLFPTGGIAVDTIGTWTRQAVAIPAAYRGAVQAACAGRLSLPRPKRSPKPKPEPAI